MMVIVVMVIVVMVMILLFSAHTDCVKKLLSVYNVELNVQVGW